ncbi:General transcription factor IIF subunit 2, variant 3 [Trebouxia sp. C0009 RCD-2024]
MEVCMQSEPRHWSCTADRHHSRATSIRGRFPKMFSQLCMHACVRYIRCLQGRPKRLRLTVPEAQPGQDKIPEVYNINHNTSDITGLRAFVQDKQHADLVGSVSQRIDVEVIRDGQEGNADPAYRALSRQRNTQANERARTAQQVEPKDIMNAQRLARLREPASMKSAHKRVAAAREARANQIKLDAQQLESLLFQLFERKPSWRMIELKGETRQSIESIKKVLDGIAVQITRGPARGEYELRSEYKPADAAPS